MVVGIIIGCVYLLAISESSYYAYNFSWYCADKIYEFIKPIFERY